MDGTMEQQKQKKKKLPMVLPSVIFLVLIFGFTVMSFLTPVKGFSENENRMLAQKPEFSWKTLFNGSFTKDYETFITDQFFARDTWIGMKTWMELGLQKKEINGVYFAKDGYLIETQDADSVDAEQLAKNEERLIEFISKYSEKLGADQVHAMLVPTASELLSEKLPAFAQTYPQQELLNRIRTKLPPGSFLDAGESLREQKDDYIFYKTDHHWTAHGAYYAYQQWADACGFTPWDKSKFQVEKVSDSFYGTIYSKINIKTTEPDEIYLYQTDQTYQVEYDLDRKKKDTLYELGHLETKDQYSVYLDGNHALVQIDTDTKENEGRKLLIIKDSFAHTFTPFAVNHFPVTYMVDFRYFNMPISQFIENYGITDILVLYNVKSFMTDKNLYQLER